MLLVLVLGAGCASGSVNCDCECWPCGQFGPTDPCLCEDAIDECPRCSIKGRAAAGDTAGP